MFHLLPRDLATRTYSVFIFNIYYLQNNSQVLPQELFPRFYPNLFTCGTYAAQLSYGVLMVHASLRGVLMKRILVTLWLVSTCLFGMQDIPQCPAYNTNLSINNDQVLHWKRTTSNQFRERAHVKGPISKLYQDRNGHYHFEINIGRYDDDSLEVIYNQEFGALPDLDLNMTVEACGDYITSTERSGPYPPSPDGAIIHWVHMNPSYRGHPPGFLIINGSLYGTHVPPEEQNGRPKPIDDSK